MGLTTSAIQLASSEEDDEEEDFHATPLAELTPDLMRDYLNSEVLSIIKKWAISKSFLSLLGTNSFLWKNESLKYIQIIRTDNIVNLKYWDLFPQVEEVILFCGDEPFLLNMQKYPRFQFLEKKRVTLVTSNDNTLEFLIASFSLISTEVRIEFILDSESHNDFPGITGTQTDYEIVRKNLVKRFYGTCVKVLEIVLVDQRSDLFDERVVFDKIDYESSSQEQWQ